MSRHLFPAISGPSDPRWGQAIRRGRAERNIILAQIRARLSRQGDDTAHAERMTETPRRPDANHFTQGSSVVEQETHTLHAGSSILPPAPTLPQACGSGPNDVGGGLSAGVAAKVIESVGPARGRSGADECMPTTKTNRVSGAAAQAIATASNSAAACPAAGSNFPAAGSLAGERSVGDRLASVTGFPVNAEAGGGATPEDAHLVKQATERSVSACENENASRDAQSSRANCLITGAQTPAAVLLMPVSKLDEQGSRAAAGSISNCHDHG